MRDFFRHGRALICQLKSEAHAHTVVLVGVHADFLKTPLPPQHVVTAVAGDAKDIRTQFFGRVNLDEVHVQRHERILHHVLRLVAIPDQPPHEPR